MDKNLEKIIGCCDNSEHTIRGGYAGFGEPEKIWRKNKLLKEFVPFYGNCTVKFLESLAKNYGRRSFIDLGCGDGRNVFIASYLGFDACGVDINPNLIRLCNEHLNQFKEQGLDLDCNFSTGNFIPYNLRQKLRKKKQEEHVILAGKDAFKDLDRKLEEMDILFIYPWAEQVPIVFDIFKNYTKKDALLAIVDIWCATETENNRYVDFENNFKIIEKYSIEGNPVKLLAKK